MQLRNGLSKPHFRFVSHTQVRSVALNEESFFHGSKAGGQIH
jgi:hypothetical protein